jgi:hypothetical protein
MTPTAIKTRNTKPEPDRLGIIDLLFGDGALLLPEASNILSHSTIVSSRTVYMVFQQQTLLYYLFRSGYTRSRRGCLRILNSIQQWDEIWKIISVTIKNYTSSMMMIHDDGD